MLFSPTIHCSKFIDYFMCFIKDKPIVAKWFLFRFLFVWKLSSPQLRQFIALRSTMQANHSKFYSMGFFSLLFLLSLTFLYLNFQWKNFLWTRHTEFTIRIDSPFILFFFLFFFSIFFFFYRKWSIEKGSSRTPKFSLAQ